MNRAAVILCMLAMVFAGCMRPMPEATGDVPAAVATMTNTPTATIQPPHTSTATATERWVSLP